MGPSAQAALNLDEIGGQTCTSIGGHAWRKVSSLRPASCAGSKGTWGGEPWTMFVKVPRACDVHPG